MSAFPCPDCNGETRVASSTLRPISDECDSVQRVRECQNPECGLRFHTREIAIWLLPEPLQAFRRASTRKLPVEIRGVSYPSVAAAARALHVRPQTISNAKAQGRLDTVGLPYKNRAQPVRIRGVTYASLREASAILGIHRRTLHQLREPLE